MTDLIWDGNSREIFDKAVSLAPKPFQEATISSLTEAIEKRLNAGGHVTVDMVVDAIKEVTPKPFLAIGMRKIKPLLEKS